MNIQLIRSLLKNPQINGKLIFDPANSEDSEISAFLKQHSDDKWIKFLIKVNDSLGSDQTNYTSLQLASIEQDLIKYIKDSYGSDGSESVNPFLQDDIRGKTPEAKLITNMAQDQPIENAVNMAVFMTEKLKNWVEPKPGLLDNLTQLFSELGDKLEALFNRLLKLSPKSLPMKKPETDSIAPPPQVAPPQEAAAQMVKNSSAQTKTEAEQPKQGNNNLETERGKHKATPK